MGALAAVLSILLFTGTVAAATGCVAPGAWVAPGTPARTLEAPALFASVAKRPAVLLGEAHDSAEHHRWQLHVIAALHTLRPDLVLGFESFPRRVQPALDRWVAGELSESEFLAASDWRNVWGMDPVLYMPLFHFARMNRIPMVALNVERSLTRAVREKGFDAVPESQREGVTRPAPPSTAYVDYLYPVFVEHETNPGDKKEKPARDSADFRRFLESQTLWDRAMAQGLAEALARRPGTLAIGIMGRDHVARGYGVPHQLAALGVRDAAVLLPWDQDGECDGLVAGLADAVFGVAAVAAASSQRPRLGVRIEPAEGGVRIAAVEAKGIAEAAGLRAGDVIVEIAGRAAKQTGDVVEVIGRQAPGTWLPLRVKRDGALVDIVARFPPLAN